MISLATLKCLGYNGEMTQQLWDYWTHWPSDEAVREVDDQGSGGRLVMPFIETAIGQLSHELDPHSEDNEAWHL